MRKLLRSECIKCMAEKNMSKIPEGATEEQKLVYLQGMLAIISKAPVEVCAPVIVRDINKLSQEIFGTAQDYFKEKTYYNRLMLEKEEAYEMLKKDLSVGAEEPGRGVIGDMSAP